jgi:hypothetical protein
LIRKEIAKPSLGLENPEVQWDGERENVAKNSPKTRDAARASSPQRIRGNPEKGKGFSIPQRTV